MTSVADNLVILPVIVITCEEEKNSACFPKVGLYDLLPVCVSVYAPYQLLNA
jgi:hypothetical protein